MVFVCRKPFTVAVDEYLFYRGFRAGMEGRFGLGILRTGPTRDDDYEYLLLMQPQPERVVAAAKLLVGPGRMYLAFLETAHDAKRQGNGRYLFSKLFQHAVQRGVEQLEISQYSRLGQDYLAPMEEKLARKYYPRMHAVCAA